MQTSKILVFDYGTTSLKTSLFDENMELIDIVYKELYYEYPQKKYVEMEADRYWQLVLCSTHEILERNRCRDSVEIISITGQAETLIPIDKKGNPTRKAIVWLDTRAEEECRLLKSDIGMDDFYAITGLKEIEPVWPVNKIVWIKNNEKEVYHKTYKFLLLKDFILFKLTGELVSDPTVCSWSGYFDIHARQWSGFILNRAEIDLNKLAVVRPCTDIIGGLKPEIQEILGFSGKVRVVNGLLDQCASAIGAGNVEPGMLTETTGTAMALALIVDNLNRTHFTDKINIICHALPHKYVILPYCQTTGIILKWFKDKFCESQIALAREQNRDIYTLLDEMVEQHPWIDTKLIVLPHFCGSTSPENNPDASGVLFGLNLDTGKAGIIKAIMESTAFLLRVNIDLLRKNRFIINEVISLGGAARSPVWLQLKSDVLNSKVISLVNEETSSLGCAFMAAFSMGYYKDIHCIRKFIKIKKEYLPDLKNADIYEKKYNLYLKLYDNMRDLYKYTG